MFKYCYIFLIATSLLAATLFQGNPDSYFHPVSECHNVFTNTFNLMQIRCFALDFCYSFL